MRALCVVSLISLPSLIGVAMLPGCASQQPNLPATAPTIETGWRTMQAEHRVVVDFATADGKREKKALRGAIAIERPGKLRLAALGPGGIRLFDLLVINSQVTILYSFRAMAGSTFGAAIQSMAADLGAAYFLAPAASDRTIEKDATSVTIKENGHTVHLSRFVAARGHAVPTRIEAETERYHFVVDVVSIEIDKTLSPQLFLSEGNP